jgi:hypothetical protein
MCRDHQSLSSAGPSAGSSTILEEVEGGRDVIAKEKGIVAMY